MPSTIRSPPGSDVRCDSRTWASPTRPPARSTSTSSSSSTSTGAGRAAVAPAVEPERPRAGNGRGGPGGEHPGDVAAGGRQVVVVEPGGVDGGVAELVAGRQLPQEADVGGEAEDRGLVERPDQRAPGGLAVGAVDDHLAEHRVEAGADDLAGLQRRVDAGRGRPLDAGGGAGLRQEVVERVLGVHPGLDGVTVEVQVVLGERQLLAGGHPQLERDEVGVRSRARSPGARPGAGCSSPGSTPLRCRRRAGTPRCPR